MILVKVDQGAPPLEGENIYTGWFLTYLTHDLILREALGINTIGSHAAERLMLIRVGDKGAFKVSPVSGRLVGFELFGVRTTNSEILSQPVPNVTRAGALTIPLALPYDPIIFEQGRGEAPSHEAGFRQIGYRVAATRTADLFRVQFFRGGPAERYLRVADCLIAGLSDEGALVELWLEQVQKTGQHG